MFAMPAQSDSSLQALPQYDAAVALWLRRLECDDADVATLARSLSATEHTRAARFGTEALRRRWIVGRATLRQLLGQHLNVDPAAVPLRRGVRGRPELDMPQAPDFNVSHSGNTALIAIGVGLGPDERIGVDVERADRKINADGLARRVLSERERSALAPLDPDARRRRFLRLWTCKEAMSKATGDALSAPFRKMEVALDDGIRLSGGQPPYEPARWRLFAAHVPDEFIATVAVWRRA
jgi:4'-phosphopantetheinyl transferase